MRSLIVVIAVLAWPLATGIALAQQREAPPQRKSKVTLTEDQERLVEAFGALHDIGQRWAALNEEVFGATQASSSQGGGRLTPAILGTCQELVEVAIAQSLNTATSSARITGFSEAIGPVTVGFEIDPQESSP